MSKVTTKLQVTIPKAIADEHGIRPGDEVQWVSAGDSIRVIPGQAGVAQAPDLSERLRGFDQATKRQHDRERGRSLALRPGSRGWKREDLYPHGSAR